MAIISKTKLLAAMCLASLGITGIPQHMNMGMPCDPPSKETKERNREKNRKAQKKAKKKGRRRK